MILFTKKTLSTPLLFNALLSLGFYIYISNILLLDPKIGLADNKDFSRITPKHYLYHSLVKESDWDRNYFDDNYIYIKDDSKRNLNFYLFNTLPTDIIVYFSEILNYIFNSNKGYFNIGYLGFICCLSYAITYYYFLNFFNQNYNYKSIIVSIASFFVFGDILFISYFNSFYQEGTFILISLLFTILFISKPKNNTLLILALGILIASKTQNIIYLLFLPFIINYKKANYYTLTFVAILIPFVLLISSLQMKVAKPINISNSFFCGVLYENDKASSVIQEFQLDPKIWTPCINKFACAFNKNDSLKNAYYSKVSTFKILVYYIKNPTLLIKNYLKGLEFISQNPRVDYLSNMTKSFSTEKRLLYQKANYWSRFLGKYFCLLYAIPFFLSIYLIFNCWKLKYKLLKLDIIIIIYTSLIPLLIFTVILGDGYHEFIKHNLNTYFTLSIVFILSIYKIFFFQKPIFMSRIEIENIYIN